MRNFRVMCVRVKVLCLAEMDESSGRSDYVAPAEGLCFLPPYHFIYLLRLDTYSETCF
jgi:hypothetical protein